MDDFGPIKELTTEEVENDTFFKKYKKNSSLVRVEKAQKKRSVGLNFLKTFRFFGDSESEKEEERDERMEEESGIKEEDGEVMDVVHVGSSSESGEGIEVQGIEVGEVGESFIDEQEEHHDGGRSEQERLEEESHEEQDVDMGPQVVGVDVSESPVLEVSSVDVSVSESPMLDGSDEGDVLHTSEEMDIPIIPEKLDVSLPENLSSLDSSSHEDINVSNDVNVDHNGPEEITSDDTSTKTQKLKENGAESIDHSSKQDTVGPDTPQSTQSPSPQSLLPHLQSIPDVNLIKKTVKKQLIKNPKVLLSPDQFNELYSIMDTTVNDHEGNSTLLIGPRGSGKTTLIDKCLERLTEKHQDSFVTIRLNSFVHSDEHSAIKEIASQFTKIFKDRDIKGTLEARQLTSTFNNVLNFLDSSEDTQKRNLPIIFVIDNLEAFTNGNKQILLYNLFEMTQTGKSPICIIGTSTKFNTRELLEKRVRSRFSQRLIIMNKFSKFEQFSENCLNNVLVSDQTINELQNQQYGHQWNSYFTELSTTNSNFKKNLLQTFHTTKNFKSFNNSMFLPISKITPQRPFPNDSLFNKYTNNQMTNPVEAIVTSLSTLELLLVISCARFLAKSNLYTVNFSIAYREYCDMMKQFNIDKSVIKSSSVTNYSVLTNLKVNHKIWDANVVKTCWMSVYRQGLLIDYVPNVTEGGIQTSSSNKYFIVEDTKMLQLDVSLNELSRLLKDGHVFKSLTRI